MAPDSLRNLFVDGELVGMTALKRLQLIWHRELVAYLDSLEIFTCERCGKSYPKPDISHGTKRRFLITRDAYFFACRLCRTCHRWADEGKGPGKPYEKATHERLARIHNEIIAQRGVMTAVSG